MSDSAGPNLIACQHCTRGFHKTKHAHAGCPRDGLPIVDHAREGLCPDGLFAGASASSAKPRTPRDERYRRLWRFIHRLPTRTYDPATVGERIEREFWQQLPPTCPCRAERAGYPPLDVSTPAAFFVSGVVLHNHVNEKQGKPIVTLARAAKIHGAEGLFPPALTRWDREPVRLRIDCDWSLGDEVALTAAIHDIHAAHPGLYEISLKTPTPSVFEGVGVVAPDDRPPDLDWKLNYYCPTNHLIGVMRDALADVLNRPIPAGPPRPHLVLSEAEKGREPPVAGPYWVMAAGFKLDAPIKGWPAGHWQAVVDHFAGRIQFVQVGAVGPKHVARPLAGTIDLAGKTSPRELFALVAHPHCLGIVCGITSVLHIAAAFGKPAVVVAGAREGEGPARYPGVEWLGSHAPCAGCWRLRARPFRATTAFPLPVLDPFPQADSSLCDHPKGDFASCMTEIPAASMIAAVERVQRHRRPPALKTPTGFSLCVITHGRRPAITRAALATLSKLASPVPVEIVLAGNTAPFADVPGVRRVEASDLAERGLLGALRNAAGDAAALDTLLFFDDDIFPPPDFLSRLMEFSARRAWDVMGSTVWEVDGSVLHKPPETPYDRRCAVTGAFAGLRRGVFDAIRWDGSIPFYAAKRGGKNEDIEFSERLHWAGYDIAIDPGNKVWHWREGWEDRFSEEFSASAGI